jgi:hypothetical protein
MGLIVKRAWSRTGLFWLMAVAGAIAGVGFGFRTDILIMLLPLGVSVLCFRRTAETSRWHRAGVGVCGTAVFVLVFAVTAWPVIGGYSRGSNTAHVALLGLATSFDAALGLQATHYEILPLYLDNYEEAVIRDFARSTSDVQSPVAIGTEEYDKQSYRYLRRVAAAFPADMIVRAVAATIAILDLGFSDVFAHVPDWLRNSVLARALSFRERAAVTVPFLGLIAATCVALGLLAADLRAGLFFIFIVTFLAGSAALQFLARHFFYLEFIGWWSVAFSGAETIRACLAYARRRTLPAWLTAPRLLRAIAACSGILVGCGLALWGARAYQQKYFNQLISQYLNAAATDLTVTTTTDREGSLLLRPLLSELGREESEQLALVQAAYLKVDVDPSLCEEVAFDLTARYTATSPGVDFTHRLTVPLPVADPRPVVVLLPVFVKYVVVGRPEISSRFDGIEVEPNAAPCISAIRRVSPRDASGLMVTVILPPDWPEVRHYQTLVGIESRYDGKTWATQIYSAVTGERVRRSILERPVESIAPTASYSFPAVRFVGRSGLEMSARANGPYAYLVQTTGRRLQPGRYAIAEGRLFSGGLAFGLLRDDAWHQHVYIGNTGRFIAVVQTLTEGSFSIVLANDNNSLITPTSFRVDRIGWTDLGE